MTSVPECVFCRIVSDAAPARIVGRLPGAVAFLPLRPAATGHVLVVPNGHVTSPVEMGGVAGRDLADAVLVIARRVLEVLQPEGLNILQSTGAAATQSVDHLHVHVVPRAHGDGLPALWPPGRQWAERDLDRIAAALRVHEIGDITG